ncbi:MAG: MBL fold metallo-hydrolase [Cyanobacteria bacterium]|nr:MBL fold metallo-hydrolase [Cyanobacteriota bacterium]
MFVQKFFEPAIAQSSYLIGCARTGESIVIDANRDVDQYIATAAREGLHISHVTETHIHADFVSGSRELAQKTGARLLLSDEGDSSWKYRFAGNGGGQLQLLHDGDRIAVGNILVDVLHTPGHTPEHLTFLITDGAAADKPFAAVTGDFLFVGDVGRPDLLERAAHYVGTMEASARTLWRSLQRFSKLDDWLQIWPGHGAGSACGKGISAIPSSTLGYERRFNWAFRQKTEDEFVTSVLAGQPEPPKYFAAMKQINKEGPGILGGFQVPPRQPDDILRARIAAGSVVLDTRPSDVYARGHLANTLNIPFNASFVTWAGWLIPTAADVYVIVADEGPQMLREIVRSLALIGVDSVRGYFSAGAIEREKVSRESWNTVEQITPIELSRRLQSPDIIVVDVRGAGEWATGHLTHAIHIPLGSLEERLNELPRDKTLVVQCQSGARSSIAASVLEQHGFEKLINLSGGLAAWRAADLPIAGDVDAPYAIRS